MRKLKIVSAIIVLLLFCPFLKQCENNKKGESTESGLDSVNGRLTKTEITQNSEVEIRFFQDSKNYFTEDASNVFELAETLPRFVTEGPNIINFGKPGTIVSIISSLLALFLIIASFFGVFLVFKNKTNHLQKIYILNIIFIFGIIICHLFLFLFLEYFKQIKIGFYLLLISNFYMINLLVKNSKRHNINGSFF